MRALILLAAWRPRRRCRLIRGGQGEPDRPPVNYLIDPAGKLTHSTRGVTHQATALPLPLRVTPRDSTWTGAQWKLDHYLLMRRIACSRRPSCSSDRHCLSRCNYGDGSRIAHQNRRHSAAELEQIISDLGAADRAAALTARPLRAPAKAPGPEAANAGGLLSEQPTRPDPLPGETRRGSRKDKAPSGADPKRRGPFRPRLRVDSAMREEHHCG